MSPEPAPVSPAAPGLRLLMVEDDANDAELLHAYLAEAGESGAEVLHARTLGEGLRLLQAHEVHLTLLDLDLPDSSGFQTLERMREAAAGPVVVISGNAHPSLVEEVLKRRAYDVVPKDELNAATLRRVLRLARQHYETGRSLRSTETRFRATFEHAAVGLAHVDLEGRILLANERLCAILGYARAELVGLNFRDISHPEDREASAGLRARLHAGEIAQFTLRKRYRRKAGTAFWAQLTVALVRGADGRPEYEVTAVEDVSEAVHAERQLRRSERRFRALIENSADGVVLLDRDGCVRYGSPATARMLGYPRGELRGRPADELVHPDNRDAYLRDLEEVRRAPGNRIAVRTRMRRDDGVYRLFEGTLTNLLDDPSVGAVVANFGDVTERRQRERVLDEAQARSERLRRMYAALSAANESSAQLADAGALYSRTCALLVEHAGLKLAAVRLLDRGTGWVETVAHAGEPADYLAQVRVSVNGRAPDTLGPSARAVFEGRTMVCNDFLAEPTLAPWHGCAREAGIAGVMSVPLRRAGEAVGLLSLFAAEADWFDAELVGLAERMGQNLSLSLDALDRETRRQSAEQAMRESEARFRSLTELASDWFWEQDAELRFVRFAGERGDEAWGGKQADSIGRRRWEIPNLVPLSATWEEHQALLAARQPFRQFEYLRVADDGSRRYVSANGEPQFGPDGAFRGYRGTATDITARKLGEQRAQLEHQIARQLADAASAGEGLAEAIRAICQSEGWDCGRYFAYDEAAGLLRVTEAWGVADPEVERFVAASRGMTQAPGAGLAGLVLQSGAPLWLEDVTSDARVSEQGRAINGSMRSAFVFPVTLQGRCTGVLSITGRVIREPDDALLQTMLAIGTQVGQFLQRKSAEQAMRQSEARFRGLTGLSSDWYWEQDAGLRFVATGGLQDARGGISDAQHHGLLRWELPGTEAASGSWDEHKAVLAARLPFRDLLLKRSTAQGAVHYISVSGEPMFDEHGAFCGYRGIAKDVTASHEAMQALRENERRLSALFSNLPGMAYRCRNDATWASDFVSEGARALTGYAPEDFTAGRVNFGELMHPEDRERVWNATQEALRARLPFVVEYRLRTAAGGEKRVWERGTGVYAADGSVAALEGFVEDITERRQAEAALRDNEERFRNLTGLSSDWYWTQDAQFRFTHTSVDQGSPVYGDPMRPLGRTRWELPLTPLSCNWEQHRETLAAHRVFRDFEYSYLGADGELRYVSASGYPVFDADGAFAGYRGIARDITARKHAEQRLAHLAQFDPLTGLPNRALLHDRLQTTLVHARRRQSHAGILFVDLDRFKLVNDTLGHHQGDALIRQVGQRLLACVRTDDTVGRISGDEFAVVLADLARPEDAALVAQKALEALAHPFDLGGNEAYVTASIGIAVFPGDGEDAETLLKNADMAMYRAKESGRNSCCFFTAEMNRRTLAKVQLNTDLRHALERAEFRLHYQPKVDLDSGALRGMEALLRWEHPVRGTVSPAEFIPALEDSGLIVPVGEWVIEEACRQLAQWAAAGALPVPVAVNLSPKQFRRRDLDAAIREALGRHGVGAEFLELEITESCLMENAEDAVRVMQNLRAAGLKISIDDFGTGYSSLSYLTRLPLSSLKIDRSFVRDAEASAEAASIVRAIIDMAQNLRLTVIAEGVETAGQAAFLRSHGCDQAQGYFYSRPVAAERIAERLARA